MIRKRRTSTRNGATVPRPLAVIRAERGRISQWDVGLLAGIGKFRYWAIERGKYQASPAEKRAIAKALNVPVSAIAFPEPEALSA